MSEPFPDHRAGDADREAVGSRLREAAGEGRLTLEELSDRLEAAFAARTYGELSDLVADLPVAGGAPVRVGGRAPATQAEDGATLVLGILGGGTRRGRWRMAARCRVVNVMGGADLDLRKASLPDGAELTIFSLMGGSDITVPAGVVVDHRDVSLMGGDSLELTRKPPPPGAPVLRIRSYSVMGGNDIRAGKRKRSMWSWLGGGLARPGREPLEPPEDPGRPRGPRGSR